MLSRITILAALLIAVAGVARAGVVQTNSLTTTGQGAYQPSSTDLVDQASTSTFLSQTSSGFTGGFGSGGPAKLNDHLAISGNSTPETTISLTDWTTTFHLKTSVNTLGYDISGINTIADWPDNRVDQQYDVYYSTVASNPLGDDSTGYTLLKNVAYIPHPGGSTNAPSGTGGNSSLVNLAVTGVSGVNALQFVLKATANAGDGSAETVYREFDVFGTATVPEPASCVLFGLGAIGLFVAARRRRA